MDSESLKIGSLIIEGRQKRDAIHVAIAPVIADELLKPGQHVGFVKDSTERVTDREGRPIGIIDPFLPLSVAKGQRCWLFLYPGTITSLRHEWTHPAFEADKEASRKWMQGWCDEHGVPYSFAIQAGHTLNIGCYESARDYINGEWWSHWEVITGERAQRDEYFSCAC